MNLWKKINFQGVFTAKSMKSWMGLLYFPHNFGLGRPPTMIRPSKHQKLEPLGIPYFLKNVLGCSRENWKKLEGLNFFQPVPVLKNANFLFCCPWCGYIQFCSVSIPDYKNIICLLVLLGWTIPMFYEIKQTYYYYILGLKFAFIIFANFEVNIILLWKNIWLLDSVSYIVVNTL